MPSKGSFLGPRFSADEIERFLARCRRSPAGGSTMKPSCCEHVAELLAEGKVVGWFQGRMEFGPRALGARSILGDPRSPANAGEA